MALACTLRYRFKKFGFVTTCAVELVNYTCLIQMQQFLFAVVIHIMPKIFLEMSPISTNYAQFFLIYQESYACSFSVQKKKPAVHKNL